MRALHVVFVSSGTAHAPVKLASVGSWSACMVVLMPEVKSEEATMIWSLSSMDVKRTSSICSFRPAESEKFGATEARSNMPPVRSFEA